MLILVIFLPITSHEPSLEVHCIQNGPLEVAHINRLFASMKIGL